MEKGEFQSPDTPTEGGPAQSWKLLMCRGGGAETLNLRICVLNPAKVWLPEPGAWFQPQLSPYPCNFGKSLSFLIWKMGSC